MLKKPYVFHWILLFGGFGTISFFDFEKLIPIILDQFWHLKSCMPQGASRYPQDCFRLAYLSQIVPTWTNLNLTWTQVRSKLAEVGLMLAPSWFQLGSSWSPVGPIWGSPATPGPTETRSDPFPAASWPPNSLLDSKRAPKGPPKPPTWTLKAIKCYPFFYSLMSIWQHGNSL